MFASLRDWFDNRTGCRKVMEVLLIEHIPGGAKWRYVWGSTLLFVFSLQLLTGVLLMTAYSPGDSTAWSSVYFIQYEMDFGWLIRGLHHFGSQAMVVLIAIHMLQVVIACVHLPPREINWWLGMGLLAAVLGLSLTGYLLPWDQKGYYATQVATNIAGNLPVVGSFIQKIVVGGPVYGHHTLTRFYTLHVGILPPLVILLTVLHMAIFRRHGVTCPAKAKGEGWFWPEQAFRDMVISMIIFGVMVSLVLYGHGHKIETHESAAVERSLYDRIAHAGRDGKGANLDAPADPAQEYPARPEWYFLSLFQLLKYFEGEKELIGTVVIPNAIGVLLFLLPLLALGRRNGIARRFAHAVSVLAIVGILAGAALLTYEAIKQDQNNKKFQEKLTAAEAAGARAIQLASLGVPADGAVNLLRRDPLTKGTDLFRTTCAVCHSHGEETRKKELTHFTASDLTGFGTKDWILGLLKNPSDPSYFGRTKLEGMTKAMAKARKQAQKDKKEREYDDQLDLIADWLASHPREAPPKEESDLRLFAKGYRAFEEQCMSCHSYKGEGGGTAPDMAGYGDMDWLRLMVMSPSSQHRYGLKNSMPAFRDLEGVNANLTVEEAQGYKDQLLAQHGDTEAKRKEIDAATRMVHLGDVDRELILRWLLKDYRVVFGGEPIAAPPKAEK